MSRRAGDRPGHSATTAHFQAAYPFIAEGGLGAPGTYIGRDAYGGAWLYDPWELVAERQTAPLEAAGSRTPAGLVSWIETRSRTSKR